MSRAYPWLLALALATLVALTVTAAADTATRIDRLTYDQLAKRADRAIHAGHVYSHRWGDASPWLKALCYEMVDRAFSPYGTQAWADFRRVQWDMRYAVATFVRLSRGGRNTGPWCLC